MLEVMHTVRQIKWKCYANVIIVCNSAPHIVEAEHMYGYMIEVLINMAEGYRVSQSLLKETQTLELLHFVCELLELCLLSQNVSVQGFT